MVVSFPTDPYDLALLICGVLLLLVGGSLLLRTFRQKPNPFPYTSKACGTAAQRSWLSQCQQACKADFDLLVAVPLADLLDVDGRLRSKAAALARAKLEGLRADFVLLAQGTLEPRAIILLQEEKQFPAFSNAALLAAGLPVLVLPATPVLSAAELGALLQRELNPRVSVGGVTANDDWILGRLEGLPAEPEQWSLGAGPEPIARQEDPDDLFAAAGQWAPCPECGSPRSPRRVNRGRHAGRYFLVCQRYPSCQQLQPLKQRQP